MKVNLAVLNGLVTQGYLTRSKHSSADLYVYDYTDRCRREGHWTQETMMCRGLIVDGHGEIKARPFPKFMSYEEYIEAGLVLPKEPFEVTEQIDGCFLADTPLDLWDGGMVTIGEVVNGKMYPRLIGMNDDGEIVPCSVVRHFNNGPKSNWLEITVSNNVGRRAYAARQKCGGTSSATSTLVITSNHHMYINRRYQAASVARIGYEIMTYALGASSCEPEKSSAMPAYIFDVRQLSEADINTMPAFISGSDGYDIKTTTGNYFANGILVHNSLGILYFAGHEPNVATRGSFVSEQAVHATELLRGYKDKVDFGYLEYMGITLLWEIVYPRNRVIVDYGDIDDLFLIAAIDNETGRDMSIDALRDTFRVADTLVGVEDIAGIQGMFSATRGTDGEGFVVRFSSGLRLKVKFDDYVRLHRFYTGVTKHTIFSLMRGSPNVRHAIVDVVGATSKEYKEWVRTTAIIIMSEYDAIEGDCLAVYRHIKNLTSRALQAATIERFAYKPIVLRMLDGTPYSDLIWEAVEQQMPDPSLSLLQRRG